jgi:alpha-beta hydrolase superfamily lysophospholipase
VTEPPVSALTLTSADGTRIEVRVHTPAQPRAVLLVIPGLGDHAGRYDEFATAVRAGGIATFALDLRGHGRSAGQRGHASAFARFLEDVDTVRTAAQSLHPHVPLFLLGQSMGGLVLIRYLQERVPPAGAVICSPWLKTALPVPAWKRALAPLSARLLPRLPFAHGIRAEDLSHDNVMVERYRRDPLIHGRITPATFRGVTDAMRRAEQRCDRLTMPILFLVGGADRVVDTPAALQLARALDGPDVSVRELAGRYHELLNETDRRETYALIAEWLLNRS